MTPIKYHINYINPLPNKNSRLRRLKIQDSLKKIVNVKNLKDIKSVLVYENIVFKQLKKKTNSILEPKLPELLKKVSNYYNIYDWNIHISINFDTESFFFITIESNTPIKTEFVLFSQRIQNFNEYIELIEKLNSDNFILKMSIHQDLHNIDDIEAIGCHINLPSVVLDIMRFFKKIDDAKISPLSKYIEKVYFNIHLVFKDTLDWSVDYFDNNYALHYFVMMPHHTITIRKKKTYDSPIYSIDNYNELTYLNSMHDSGFIKIPDDIFENIDEDNVYETLEYIKMMEY